MTTNKITELVFSFMDMLSIPTKEVSPGIWEATIPESEQAFFNSFETYKFTFDRQLAESYRELELICEGAFILRKIIGRLAQIPKVSRLFSDTPPEVIVKEKQSNLRLLNTVTPYYRQKIIYNFKVAYECDQRTEKIYSVYVDSADLEPIAKEGIYDINLSNYSEKPNPNIEFKQTNIELLSYYLKSCKRLEEFIKDEVEEFQSFGEEQYNEQVKKFEKYLNEQKKELLKKKESVSFHLYFFQKEEEIDDMIKSLEVERKRKIAELKDKFTLKVNINLINAILLCVPTIKTKSLKSSKTSKISACISDPDNSILGAASAL